MKPYRIFLCEPIHPEALQLLEERAEIICDPARLAEADGAINRNLHMDSAWLDRCPRLKVIGIHGTGTDGVDLAAARARGIRVVYAPGENAQSVAELIVGLALSLARQLPRLDRQLQRGQTVPTGGAVPGIELRGRVFGTLGCGRIGTRAARILREGFGMQVLAYAPSLTPQRAETLGLTACKDPAELFARSDVISISLPLTNQTRGMVDDALLAQAKPGSILINTARGAIVDEAALYRALTQGPLAAAACDVFTQEPPTLANPLLALPNFLAAPHIGANTDDALRRVGLRTAEQVLAVLEGRPMDLSEP